MNIAIIAVYENLDAYICAVKKGTENVEALWDACAIEPYWDRLCEYAPGDLSERKPRAVLDVNCLERQVERLKRLDLTRLRKEFQRAAEALPNYEDAVIRVALYPLSDRDTQVKEKQNGVVGTATFGHMLLQINPLAENWEQWIPYVFAHEYHHTVFGNYWYVLQGGALQNRFIDSLLIDGEADSFALSLYPSLRPSWLFQLSDETVSKLWETHYANLTGRTDADYCKYMFGDEDGGIPWCAGYAVGYRIVQKYLLRHPEVGFSELLEKQPADILAESGYASA